MKPNPLIIILSLFLILHTAFNIYYLSTLNTEFDDLDEHQTIQIKILDFWNPDNDFIDYLSQQESPVMKVNAINMFMRDAMVEVFSHCGRKRILCPWEDCGFACQMHSVANCVAYAFKNGYVPLLRAKGKYVDDVYDYIVPFTADCGEREPDFVWKEDEGDLMFDIMPEWIREMVGEYFENIELWYVGQYLQFILRLDEELEAEIDEEVDIPHPYVGVHIRGEGITKKGAGWESKKN
eukprot:TRINITY_DN7641_c0_g1_i2.p1 TRINITY_DN7641_c0_g1~~TRINITY_DN7641_c0_g1_i2.p1  ORF type:complete len:237 (-),score=57.87 TRINITY_DN7641_c0_g1_i2:88-798(-)